MKVNVNKKTIQPSFKIHNSFILNKNIGQTSQQNRGYAHPSHLHRRPPIAHPYTGMELLLMLRKSLPPLTEEDMFVSTFLYPE